MSGGDEMGAQKITFILCIELSLKTSLNSALSGEHRVACLGITAIYLSPRADLVRETLTCQNQSLNPGGAGQSIHQMSIVYKQRTYV